MRDFAAERRMELWMLEEAYYRGRYGYVEYGEEEAKVCVRTAEEVLRLVERVEKLVEEA